MARATVPDRSAPTVEPPAPRRRSLLVALFLALRPQQCLTKNALVFAALAFARRLTDVQSVLQATIAFVLFCAASGMIYLVNDIMDVEQDRLHPRKRFRPIAAGELPVPFAWGTVVVLLIATLIIAVLLRPALATIVAIYVAVQVAYSLGLKHQVILDVFIIAAGFVLRAVAGAVAIAVPISPWLYVLIGLGALFLGFGKRRAEIVLLSETAGQHRRVLAEYSATLLEEMIAIVTATTVMAYSLYTFSAENLPRNHAMMATIPFVMYGLFRYLYLVYRKDEGGSPDQLLFTDRPLLICIVLWALTAVAILYVSW